MSGKTGPTLARLAQYLCKRTFNIAQRGRGVGIALAAAFVLTTGVRSFHDSDPRFAECLNSSSGLPICTSVSVSVVNVFDAKWGLLTNRHSGTGRCELHSSHLRGTINQVCARNYRGGGSILCGNKIVIKRPHQLYSWK